MDSINLGPFALPVAPVLLLASLLLAMGVASWSSLPPARSSTRDDLFNAMLVGLLAARLVHLVLNREAYSTDALAMLDIRDGGWHAASGVVAGVAWLVWRAWRTKAPKALGMAGAAGVLAWGAAGLALAPAAGQSVPTQAYATLQPGVTQTLAALAKGRPMVLNLWASWCTPCRTEMPAFAQAQRELPEAVFVFVNQGESAALAQRYLRSLPKPLEHVLLDPEWTLAQAVGSKALPTTLFVDAQGRIAARHIGVLSAAGLRVQVRRLTTAPAARAQTGS